MNDDHVRRPRRLNQVGKNVLMELQNLPYFPGEKVLATPVSLEVLLEHTYVARTDRGHEVTRDINGQETTFFVTYVIPIIPEFE